MNRLTFYGVRGSNPQSGPDYRMGGHTLCVAYESDHATIVFDAGTGMAAFSKQLPRTPKPTIHLCLSHYHLDHIMGLTLLDHLYTQDVHMVLHAPILEDRDPRAILEAFIAPPVYPFTFDLIGSSIEIRPFHVGQIIQIENITLSTLLLHHPGSSCGYRVVKEGVDFCYITDVGIQEGVPTYPKELGAFVQDTPLLIQDAYFSDEDFGKFHFFGHGSYRHVAEFAQHYHVGRLALFHHNPRYTDADLRAMEQQAQAYHSKSFLTYEGLRIDL